MKSFASFNTACRDGSDTVSRISIDTKKKKKVQSDLRNWSDPLTNGKKN